jgi:hypothetical protein
MAHAIQSERNAVGLGGLHDVGGGREMSSDPDGSIMSIRVGDRVHKCIVINRGSVVGKHCRIVMLLT